MKNLSRAHTILKVSTQLLIKPTKTFQKLVSVNNPSWKWLTSKKNHLANFDVWQPLATSILTLAKMAEVVSQYFFFLRLTFLFRFALHCPGAEKDGREPSRYLPPPSSEFPFLLQEPDLAALQSLIGRYARKITSASSHSRSRLNVTSSYSVTERNWRAHLPLWIAGKSSRKPALAVSGGLCWVVGRPVARRRDVTEHSQRQRPVLLDKIIYSFTVGREKHDWSQNIYGPSFTNLCWINK